MTDIIQTKFSIGDTVFVLGYDGVTQKVISAKRIELRQRGEDIEERIEYQFRAPENRGLIILDSWTNEERIFESKQAIINYINSL